MSAGGRDDEGPPAHAPSRRVRVRLAVALVLTSLALGLVLHGLRLDAIAEALRAFASWRAPAVLALYAATLSLRAARFRALLPRPVRYVRVLVVVGASHLASAVIPFHVGAFVGPYLLASTGDAPLGEGLAVVFLERMLDAIALLALTLVAAWLLESDGAISVAGVDLLAAARTTTLVACALALAALVLVALGGRLLVGAIAGAVRRISPRAARWVVRLGVRFVVAVGGLARRPRAATAALLATCAWWSTSMGAAAIVMGGIAGLPAPTLGAVALDHVAIVTGGIVVPTPGHVGGFEAGAFAAMTVLGARAEAAGIFALALHAFQLGATIAFGLACFAWAGVRVDRIARDAPAARARASRAW